TSEWMVYESHSISNWRWPHAAPGYPANSVRPGEYLVYPLLEAVLKRYLSGFIGPDGRVNRAFDLIMRCGAIKKYRRGASISSIAILLRILLQYSDDPDLKLELETLFTKIEEIYPSENAADVIYKKWRNAALHGDRHVPTASGVVLNIILLIAIASVSEEEWNARYHWRPY